MMKIAAFFVLCLSSGLFAAPVVQLSGTVSDVAGKPLKEVTVTLKGVSNLSAISGTDGSFMLKQGTVTKTFPRNASGREQLNYHFNGSSVVVVPTSGCTEGVFDLFSANGRKMFSGVISGMNASGLSVPLSAFMPGLSIVRMIVNGKQHVYPILRTGKKLFFNKDFSTMSGDGIAMYSKISSLQAPVDTLVARKTGYKEATIQVTAYIDSTMTIALESGGDCSPPETGTGKSNPIVTDVFTADPACMVDNCSFYIVCGHDQGTGGFVMREWFLLKSTDMVNWTRSTPLSLKTFSWTNANAWAGQMIKGLNGKYYWYVPINDIVYSNDRMAIGVAVAESPEGPWTDPLDKPLIYDTLEMNTWGITNIDQTPHTIDPTVFIDDDGQAYLQYGGFWTMVTVKLNPDMISLDGKLVKTIPPNYFESPYLIKRNGTYYEIYAAGSANPTTIDYATSKSPMGPWTHKGTILPKMPKVAGQDEPTNHAGVAEFAGQWYIVYHISNGPNGGGTYRRMVAIDKLKFNDDGSIMPVTPSTGLAF